MSVNTTKNVTFALVGLIIAAVLVFWIINSDKADNQTAGTDCGDVSIADMNWASAEFAAHLDAFILKHGYGCNVKIIPGDTVPTTTSMVEKAEPDIAPELWMNSVRETIAQAKEEGKLQIAAAILKDGGEEGWWIPQYTADKHPELKTVQDVLDRPDLFVHPENKNRGGFMTCPAGWGCEVANGNLSKAFEFDKNGFDLIDPGSAAGFDGSIAKAYERNQNWFGYYWAPTAILGKYPMKKLDFASDYDAKNWDGCISKPDCPNPKRSSWTVSEVSTMITANFAQSAPASVIDYLSKRSFENKRLNVILAWMSENQAPGAEGAERFLKDHEEVWSQWVSDKAVGRIKAAL